MILINNKVQYMHYYYYSQTQTEIITEQFSKVKWWYRTHAFWRVDCNFLAQRSEICSYAPIIGG